MLFRSVDKFLQGLLAAKPDMELDEMRRHLQKELQLTVSMSTISRAITRAGIATGQRPVRTRTTASTSTAGPRRRAANKAIAQKEAPAQSLTQQQQPPPLALHIPQHVPIDHLNDLPTDAHLLDPWQDLTIPTSQHQHHHPQLQPHHMHVLDPSLAPPYHNVAVYHDLYADPDPHVMALNASALDVYRTPYAPL